MFKLIVVGSSEKRRVVRRCWLLVGDVPVVAPKLSTGQTILVVWGLGYR